MMTSEFNIGEGLLVLSEARVLLYPTRKVASIAIIRSILSFYGMALDEPHSSPMMVRITPQQAEKYVPQWKRAIFVRNPFDRLVSNFHHHIHKNKVSCANLSALGFHPEMDWDEFLALALQHVGDDAHLCPQSALAAGAQFVGRFEQLDQDWDKFREFCGLALPDLEWINQTDRNPYPEYFSAQQRAMVERAYSDDLKDLGYIF